MLSPSTISQLSNQPSGFPAATRGATRVKDQTQVLGGGFA
jgi:hypothetical protein